MALTNENVIHILDKDFSSRLNNFYEYMVNLSEDHGFNKFFVRTRSHVMITVLVASRSTELFSFEKICHKIPSNIASRSTIKSILDDGVRQSYFEKYEDPKDRRIQLYRLADANLIHMNSWVKMQNKIFA